MNPFVSKFFKTSKTFDPFDPFDPFDHFDHFDHFDPGSSGFRPCPSAADVLARESRCRRLCRCDHRGGDCGWNGTAQALVAARQTAWQNAVNCPNVAFAGKVMDVMVQIC